MSTLLNRAKSGHSSYLAEIISNHPMFIKKYSVPENPNRVIAGSYVDCINCSGESENYCLIPEEMVTAVGINGMTAFNKVLEQDTFGYITISTASAVGMTIYGHEVGETIMVDCPEDSRELTILEVDNTQISGIILSSKQEKVDDGFGLE